MIGSLRRGDAILRPWTWLICAAVMAAQPKESHLHSCRWMHIGLDDQ